MRPAPRTTALLATVVLLTTALSACSSSTTPQDAEGTGTSTPRELGPLEELIGWIDVATAGPTGMLAYQRQLEEQIAACMVKEGFEYWPQVPALEDVVLTDGPADGSPEFVAAYGYGVWNVPDGSPAGSVQWTVPDIPEQQAYLDWLSESARAAYDTALYGEIAAGDTEDGYVERRGGCQQLAYEPPLNEDLAAVQAAAQDFLATLPTNSAFDDLNADWAACFRAAGYSDPSPYAARSRFHDALIAATEDAPLTDPTATEAGQAQAAEELVVAAADLTCRTATDYDARYRDIELALQQEYVTEHRAELDALAGAR